MGVATQAALLGTTRSCTWTSAPGAVDWTSATENLSRISMTRAVPDLLVQLAEQLAGHRMHERDRVAPQAHERAELQAVGGGQIDDDPGRLHEDDVAALGRFRRRHQPQPA